MFYANLEQAFVSTDYFTLVSFINTLLSFNQLTVIKIAAYDSANISKNTDKETHTFPCNQSLKTINADIVKLDNKYDTIIHLVGHTVNTLRTKRGIITGGSQVLNWLFGTPSADDSKY